MSNTITIELREIDSVINGLAKSGDVLLSVAKSAISTVSKYAKDQSIQGVVKDVNLTTAYVKDKVDLTPVIVSGNSVEAKITGRYRATRLATYIHQVSSEINEWTEAKFNEKFGDGAFVRPNPKVKLMPWTKRTGDRTAGVAAGRKTAGVRSGVKAGGGLKPISYAFLRKTTNGIGIFAHVMGQKKTKQLYGPSVHQVITGVWDRIDGDVSNRLSSEIELEIDRQIPTILGTS
jgi:hypothetical protein